MIMKLTSNFYFVAGKLFGAPSTSASTGLFGSGTTGTQKSSLFGGTSGFQSTGETFHIKLK